MNSSGSTAFTTLRSPSVLTGCRTSALPSPLSAVVVVALRDLPRDVDPPLPVHCADQPVEERLPVQVRLEAREAQQGDRVLGRDVGHLVVQRVGVDLLRRRRKRHDLLSAPLLDPDVVAGVPGLVRDQDLPHLDLGARRVPARPGPVLVPLVDPPQVLVHREVEPEPGRYPVEYVVLRDVVERVVGHPGLYLPFNGRRINDFGMRGIRDGVFPG